MGSHTRDLWMLELENANGSIVSSLSYPKIISNRAYQSDDYDRGDIFDESVPRKEKVFCTEDGCIV